MQVVDVIMLSKSGKSGTRSKSKGDKGMILNSVILIIGEGTASFPRLDLTKMIV
jgi:hypothetical protein